MANVLLTERCVRSCPYCFAKKHMADAPDDNILSWTNLIYIADFLQASGENHISLLGGEPTVHPHFAEFVVYLLERNFHINVFTSGIMSDRDFQSAERHLSGVNPERLSFVCNLNEPEKSNFSELENVRRFLRTFGHLTSPGFNIYRPQFKLDFIFDYIKRYGLKPFLRLGLAHPIPGQKNAFVRINEMPQMAETLSSYLPRFERFRVRPGFDCGFPICNFTDEQLGQFFKVNGGQVSFGCGPAVDIGPDMSVWACFPLSDFHKRSLYEFDNMQHLMDFFNQQQQSVRCEVSGIYEACDECIHRKNELCAGGCLAHTLSNIQGEERVRLPEVYGQR